MLALVEKHCAALSRTRTLIELVETEDALRTPNVRDVVLRLVQVGENLQNQLNKMAVKRSCVRDFIRQVISGQENEAALERILRDLESTKHDLSVHIQLANVGLTQGVDKTLQVSVAAVESVNRQIQTKLGPTHNLRITKVLENRPQNSETRQLLHSILPQLTGFQAMGLWH